MQKGFTAVVKQSGPWWIGWIEEIPGVNCQERTREELLETLRVTLREAYSTPATRSRPPSTRRARSAVTVKCSGCSSQEDASRPTSTVSPAASIQTTRGTRKIKSDLEVGGALPDVALPQQVDDALRQVGFELLESRDLTENPGPSIPWYQPLAGLQISFASFRSSTAGRMATHGTLQLMEALGIVPKGTVRVSGLLNLCATAMVASGRLGIFTPMYFVYARKPQ